MTLNIACMQEKLGKSGLTVIAQSLKVSLALTHKFGSVLRTLLYILSEVNTNLGAKKSTPNVPI